MFNGTISDPVFCGVKLYDSELHIWGVTFAIEAFGWTVTIVTKSYTSHKSNGATKIGVTV